MSEAIDRAETRLRRRVEAASERPQSRQLRHRDEQSWHHDDRPTERPHFYPRPLGERELVRRKTFALRPESIEEALFDLEILDHDFFLFVHDETNAEAVVYRVGDGYGLMQRVPTPEAIKQVEIPLDLGPHPTTTTVENALTVLDETDAPFEFFVDDAQRTRHGRVPPLRRPLRAHPSELRIERTMTDIEHWIDLHETELHDLAERTDTHDDTVHFLATLVLAGWTDDAIYEQLRELIPSLDGQRSPLEDAPVLLEEVRRLAATS